MPIEVKNRSRTFLWMLVRSMDWGPIDLPNNSYPQAVTMGGVQSAPLMPPVNELQPGIRTDSSDSLVICPRPWGRCRAD